MEIFKKFSLFHFLPFFLIFHLRKTQNENDIIQNSTYEFQDDNYSMIFHLFSLIPLLYFLKSSSYQEIEHGLAIVSLFVAAKLFNIVFSTCENSNIFHGIFILFSLILINKGLVKNSQIKPLYLFMILFSLFGILTQNYNSKNILDDYMYTHIIFFLLK